MTLEKQDFFSFRLIVVKRLKANEQIADTALLKTSN